MAKRILYGLEDYARDRYTKAAPVAGVARPVTYTPTPSAGTTPQSIRGEGQRLNRTVISPAAAQNVRRVANRPLTEDASNTNTGGQGQSEISTGERALTANELTLIRRLDDLSAAQENLSRVLNRRFSYDETSSPLYSILQKQYEQEAEKAAGRAYASATANTGGYGSSYATMAGEDARRQVMSGFGDMQDELYQAAWDEFQAERQSATEWYAAAKQMAEDQELIVEKEKAEAADKVTGMTEEASNAAQYLLDTYGMAYSEKAMRQDLLGKGYSEADVNAALENQRKMVSGAVTDYNAGDITSAVAQAKTLDEAYRQGQLTVEEYDEAKAKNSKVIMESINKGMERIEDTDYRALGISEEEWNALEDGEKKLAVIDRIGQLVKSGVVNDTDYVKMLSKDLDEEFSSKEYKKSDTQLRDAMDSALVIQDLYDSGYLRDDSYKYLLYEKIVPQFEGTRFWEVLDIQDKSLGEEKEYKRGSNPFNAIENYNSAQSYGSPMTAKTSKSLSHDHKELLLKIVRERRKAIREHAASKGAKGATRA